MASSSSICQETWEDELLDVIATYACQKAKTFVDHNGKNDYECFRLHVFCQQKILEQIQCEIDKLQRLNDELRSKDPEKYRYQLISKKREAAFFQKLHSSTMKVKFIDELFKCDKLKYDSPPAAINAKARELFEKYPLESDRIARKLVEDHVRRLLQLHEAKRKFKLQNWLQSYQAITECSSIFDDLKLLEGSKKFQRFRKAEIQSELEAYKCFLFYHGGKEKAQGYTKYIMDNRDRIIKLCEKKPYDNENGILNLAAQVVHQAYVIKDVKEEIIRLHGL